MHPEALLGNLWLLSPDVRPASASAAYVLGEICWRDTALSQGKMCWTEVIFSSDDCSDCFGTFF